MDEVIILPESVCAIHNLDRAASPLIGARTATASVVQEQGRQGVKSWMMVAAHGRDFGADGVEGDAPKTSAPFVAAAAVAVVVELDFEDVDFGV